MAREQSGNGKFNVLPGIFIVAMLAIFLVLVSWLVMRVLSGSLDLFTVVSMVFAIFICLPLAVHLWRSSKDAGMRMVFLALACDFSLLLLSAVLWYGVPEIFLLPWAPDLGKIVMILAYLPPLAALLYLFANRLRREGENFSFVMTMAGLSIFLILLSVGMNYSRAGDNGFDVAIFTLSTVIDIVILTLCVMLAIVNMQNQFRYIFSTLIFYFLLALIGDGVSVLSGLGLYSRSGDSVYIFDIMLVFMAMSMLFFALNRDRIATVEEVSRQLRDTRSLMQDLIMQSPDAICIFDVDGSIVQANPSFLRLLRNDNYDGSGKLNLFRDIDQLVHSPAGAVDDVRRGKIVTYEGSGRFLSRDVRPGHYSVKIFPTLDARGVITSYTLFVVDITEQQARKAELQAAKDDAELYLDLMGHDINNMHQIAMGYLEFARGMLNLDEQQKQLIDRPYEVMQRSSRLIHNVRKLQKARSGEFLVERVDLCQMLTDVVTEFDGTPGRTITLNCKDHNCYVMANELLQDVFVNLIGNSIKHSGTGHATITITLDRVQDSGSHYCRVSVEDSGPGIPDDLKARIFNRMSRGPTKARGTGLGLYLARSLVESYHGRIRVEDRIPGDHTRGVKFVVMLPAHEL